MQTCSSVSNSCARPADRSCWHLVVTRLQASYCMSCQTAMVATSPAVCVLLLLLLVVGAVGAIAASHEEQRPAPCLMSSIGKLLFPWMACTSGFLFSNEQLTLILCFGLGHVVSVSTFPACASGPCEPAPACAPWLHAWTSMQRCTRTIASLSHPSPRSPSSSASTVSR